MPQAEFQDVGVDCIITITETRKKYWLFGPEIEIVSQYRGSGTVWHHYPSARRCNITKELELSRLWTAWQWRN